MVVCGMASSTTVWVVICDSADVEIRAWEEPILLPNSDLDSEETVVGMPVVTLVWMESQVVVDAGTFVVKRLLPRMTSAGCRVEASKSLKEPINPHSLQ